MSVSTFLLFPRWNDISKILNLQDIEEMAPKCYTDLSVGCSMNTLNLTKSVNTLSVDELNVYDAMCPKNENRFLQYIRKWEKKMGFVTPIIWLNLGVIVALHVVTLVWSFYAFWKSLPKWQTFLYFEFLITWVGFGVVGGVHRHFCHRSYKVTMPLKIILIICYSAAGQNSIFNWVRDHRVHHKNSDTVADPHDVRRGFFFSHVGWLMMKKHPAVISEGTKIDMSDILNDPIISFHTKYFQLFKLLFCFVLPPLVSRLCWGETWELSIVMQLLRYVYILNATWSVNSLAHLWGNKPYDKSIKPSENWMVSMLAGGEGWHNYHHTFPSDYKAAELPYTFNLSTVIIHIFSYIGWAYDLKATSPELIKSVIVNRGPKTK